MIWSFCVSLYWIPKTWSTAGVSHGHSVNPQAMGIFLWSSVRKYRVKNISNFWTAGIAREIVQLNQSFIASSVQILLLVSPDAKLIQIWSSSPTTLNEDAFRLPNTTENGLGTWLNLAHLTARFCSASAVTRISHFCWNVESFLAHFWEASDFVSSLHTLIYCTSWIAQVTGVVVHERQWQRYLHGTQRCHLKALTSPVMSI